MFISLMHVMKISSVLKKLISGYLTRIISWGLQERKLNLYEVFRNYSMFDVHRLIFKVNVMAVCNLFVSHVKYIPI